MFIFFKDFDHTTPTENYLVGFFSPKGDFVKVNEFPNLGSAASYVNYLNGGTGEAF